ncbi:MAG: gamma carbonic anhydrase family protein [Gammaproteobacteria bacterium]
MIYTLGDRRVQTAGEEYYVAPSAQVIGSVRLGRWASVWFNCVVRGDSDWIEIGDRTNVQDGSVLHTDTGYEMVLEQDVTIGHMVFLHTCRVGAGSLIGNCAMVMDRARIGRGSIVAANSFVPPDKVIPDGVVVMGQPARIVREATDRDRELMQRVPVHYVENARRFRAELQAAG